MYTITTVSLKTIERPQSRSDGRAAVPRPMQAVYHRPQAHAATVAEHGMSDCNETRGRDTRGTSTMIEWKRSNTFNLSFAGACA